jgi:DNA (cytosine-5)-methyltransferase 1
VAAWIGQRLKAPGTYDRSRDGAVVVRGDWPKAARSDGKICREIVISEYPKWAKRQGLQEFLRHQPNLLSARATAGFLSRIEKSSLRFVPGFKERVRAHLVHVRALDAFVEEGRMLVAAE